MDLANASSKQLKTGELVSLGPYRIFWGNRHFSTDFLPKSFANLHLYSLRQIHSNKVIPAQPDRPTADGHWTTESNLALAIITADCLPVFLVAGSLPQPTIIGLHAGWKGLVGGIFSQAMAATQHLGIPPHEWTAFIGPHIQKESFLFSRSDLEPFVAEAQRLAISESEFISPSPWPVDKVHVDLKLLAQRQLEHLGLSPESIWLSSVNTFTSPEHHSYRRDKETHGRQVSLCYTERGPC